MGLETTKNELVRNVATHTEKHLRNKTLTAVVLFGLVAGRVNEEEEKDSKKYCSPPGFFLQRVFVTIRKREGLNNGDGRSKSRRNRNTSQPFHSPFPLEREIVWQINSNYHHVKS